MRMTEPTTYLLKRLAKEHEKKTAALESERNSGTLGVANASQSSTKGVEEMMREVSGNCRSSQYEKKSNRWDWRGEDERTKNRLRDEVTKAMAQLVRHRRRGQVRFEQQHFFGRNGRPRKFEILA